MGDAHVVDASLSASAGPDAAAEGCEIFVRREHDDEVVICVVGEVDCFSADSVRSRLSAATVPDRGSAVIDLRDLRFIDVGGARVIDEASRRFRAQGLDVALVGGPPTVRWLLREVAPVDE